MRILKIIFGTNCVRQNCLQAVGLLVGFVLLSGSTFAVEYWYPSSLTNTGGGSFCQSAGTATLTSGFSWAECTGSGNGPDVYPTITYQWYADGVAIGGATNSTYDAPLNTVGSVTYYCEFSWTSGNATWTSTCTGSDAGPSNTPNQIVTVVENTTANAGTDQSPGDCSTSTTLAGNVITAGTGTWSVVPSAGVTITDVNDPTSTVTGMTAGTEYTFTWTSVNGSCSNSNDMVFNSSGPGCATYCTPTNVATTYYISNTTFNTINNSSTNGCPSMYCDYTGTCTSVTQGTTHSLCVTGATGSNPVDVYAFFDWNGDGDFTDANEETLLGNVAVGGGTVCGDIAIPCNAITSGTVVMRIYWQRTDGPGSGDACSSNPGGYGEVEDYCINVTAATVPVASATSSYVACATTASLDASASSVSDGYWTIISGTGTITSTTSQATTITGLTNGTYTLQWTAIGACDTDTDQTTFVVSGLPDVAIEAGDDQFGCFASTALEGSDASPYTGLWVVSSGPNVPTFTPNANDPNATLGNLVNGTYILEWQINTGGCGVVTDNVEITVGSVPPADAGSAQAVCPESATMAATLPAGFTGTWTQTAGAAATILDPNDPNTLMYDMTAAGTYTFQWEISGGGCPGTTTDLIDVVVSACQNPAPQGTSSAVQYTGCNYLFTDDGGTGSDYSNNVLQTMTTFCPDDPNDYVTMTFNTVDLAAGDFFHVYDSPSPGAHIVSYGYSGGITDNPITSTTGCLYVTFFSNSTTTAPGWEADITCSPTPGAVDTSFISGDNCGGGGGITVCESGVYPTVNSNAGSPQDVGNGSAGGTNGCIPSGEGNSQFVYFNIVTSGHLSFSIDPAGGQDFDFMMWGPYDGGLACPGYTGDSPIRCTWALNAEPFCPWGSEAQIGLSYTSPVSTPSAVLPSDTIEGLGTCTNGPPAEDGWLYPIDAQAGEVYVMLVQNYAANAANWTFTYDDTDPTAAGLGCEPVQPLPVDLISFFGKNDKRVNKLYWITVSELNNDYFTVERSYDGINWEFVGEIDGAGTTQEGRDYTFTDFDPYVGVTYYRLKQTDIDGTTKSHGVIALNMSLADDIFSNVFPNPSNESFYFMYGGESLNVAIEITLFDNSGKEIYREERNEFNKSQGITVDTSKLPNGIYQVQLVQGDYLNNQRIAVLHE